MRVRQSCQCAPYRHPRDRYYPTRALPARSMQLKQPVRHRKSVTSLTKETSIVDAGTGASSLYLIFPTDQLREPPESTSTRCVIGPRPTGRCCERPTCLDKLGHFDLTPSISIGRKGLRDRRGRRRHPSSGVAIGQLEHVERLRSKARRCPPLGAVAISDLMGGFAANYVAFVAHFRSWLASLPLSCYYLGRTGDSHLLR